MKDLKTVVEGYFQLPYQGQMRFSVTIADGELVFADGDKQFNNYFCQYITTYHYTKHPDRQHFLNEIAHDIKRFVEGKERKINIKVDFRCDLFGTTKEATGYCELIRLYC